MGSGMSCILPPNEKVGGLYLGSFRDARDRQQLTEFKISHVLSVHDNAKNFDDGMEYFCITASDSPTEDLSRHFAKSNDFIHAARLNGGNVLVHCLAGISRSTTLVVAYVMSVTEHSWRDVFNGVRVVRREAEPNFGFKKQLQIFESESLIKERERILAKFKAAEAIRQADHEACKSNISMYGRAFPSVSSYQRYPFLGTDPVPPLGLLEANRGPKLNGLLADAVSGSLIEDDAKEENEKETVAQENTDLETSKL